MTTLLRGVIITSLLGHGLANILLDRDQYVGAGQDVLARLDDPFLVQAVLGVLAVAAVSIWERRRGHQDRRVLKGWVPLGALLVGLQLFVFVGLEVSERYVVELFAGEAADVGLFGIGFIAELAVAVGSSFVLVVFFQAARSFLGTRAANAPIVRDRRLTPLSQVFNLGPGVLAGAGGVRAPPS